MNNCDFYVSALVSFVVLCSKRHRGTTDGEFAKYVGFIPCIQLLKSPLGKPIQHIQEDQSESYNISHMLHPMAGSCV